MFTGLVQAVVRISAREGSRLWIDTPAGWNDGDSLALGESVATDGCCLTVVATGERIGFDLSEETLRRTTLGDRRVGSQVNLERAMRPADRLGGHIVQGHVDGLAVVTDMRTLPAGEGAVVRFRVPDDWAKFVVDKGSVALDGISLTIVRPAGDSLRLGEFEVWVIPHTLAMTNLGERQVGDRVNLEVDILAKHVEALVRPYAPR